MSEDPFAGRDMRTRLLSEQQSFERIEPLTRRILLAVGIITLGIGLARQLMPPDPAKPDKAAVVVDATRFYD